MVKAVISTRKRRTAALARQAVCGALIAAAALSLAACGPDKVYEGPLLTAWESQQRDRCLALIAPELRGDKVRHMSVERGAQGLDYVWVNAHVHDDQDDIDDRVSDGSSIAGHCQFDHEHHAVHVQTYTLVSGPQGAMQAPGSATYRYVAGRDGSVALASDDTADH